MLLILLATIPRFYDLGSLSFIGDEETTAFASSAMERGESAQLPSGMLYWRALPYTWVSAKTGQFVTANKEITYRLPSAILGVLTIIFMYFFVKPYFGASVAIIAALLLAFSEWHIILSRTARMYGPLLLLYMCTGFVLLKYALSGKGRNLSISILLFALTIMLHDLGIFVLMFALLAFTLDKVPSKKYLSLLYFSIVGIVFARLYSKYISSSQYDVWRLQNGSYLDIEGPGISKTVGSFYITFIQGVPLIPLVFAALGGVLGFVYIFRRTFLIEKTDDIKYWMKIFVLYSAAIFTGVLAGLGQFIGVAMTMLIMMLVAPVITWSSIKKQWPIVLGLLVISSFVLIYNIMTVGFNPAIKNIAVFPFPYAIQLFKQFPVMMLLFFGMAIYRAISGIRTDDPVTNYFILVVLVPLFLIGVLSSWGGLRYVSIIYPFLIIVSAISVDKLARAIGSVVNIRNNKIVSIFTILVAVSGVISGHGIVNAINTATLKHGEKSDFVNYESYPDHMSAGEFVRKNLNPTDIVIAEEAFTQKWYAGKVDYWFRDTAMHKDFLYKTNKGEIRDIYINSKIGELDEIKRVLGEKGKRAWLITSGETYNKWEFYLNKAQQQWLFNIFKSHKPAFTGRDNVTRVYCFNCEDSGFVR